MYIRCFFESKLWRGILCAGAVIFSSMGGLTYADQEPLVSSQVDWRSYMESKDMVWKKAPDSWDTAPFLANGFIGMQVRQQHGKKDVLLVDIARMDAQEHLDMDSQEEGMGNWEYKRYRVPVGYFTLKMPSEIKGWDLRLSLYDATLTGTLNMEEGDVQLKAYAHATQPVLVVEMEYLWDSDKAREQWAWNAYPSISPRTHSWTQNQGKKDAPNAQPGKPGKASDKFKPVMVWNQPLRPKGLLSTGWGEVKQGKNKRIMYVSIAHTYPESSADKNAAQAVKAAMKQGKKELERTHLNWWHEFYPEAFVSVPDAYWDSFYWAQIYKVGAGMRADGPVLDLQGPWTGLAKTAWPGVWWNLNVQLTYWPCYTGNRMEAAKSLSNTLKRYRQNLIDNVDPKYRHDSAGIARCSGPDVRQPAGKPNGGNNGASETGSLPWICHNLFTQYRMTMDDGFLKDEVYPLLRRSINYYIHFLEKGEDGKWHMPPTLSPEYRPQPVPDCNYDLALLRWGCQTLLWTVDRLKIKDPLAPKWKDIMENLTDYPVDENGYMIGKGVPYKNSHRHYSHLFMVYPLHIVDTSVKENADLMDKSIRHWHSLKKALQGYSFTGGASLYATLFRGDDALDMLNGLKSYLRPNTLYRETWPVIETPLSGAASIHDMILQSWNDVVNVMPAVPGAWKDLVFHNLRAEGAFLVSAERKDGAVQWVRVKSLAGEPLRLRVDLPANVEIKGSASKAMKRDEKGDWVGTPEKGQEFLLILPGAKAVVKPVTIVGESKHFGLQ